MYDPDLYLFINDDGILARNDLHRMVQTLRREQAAPVFSANQEEGTAIGYSSVTYDSESGQFCLWYTAMNDGQLHLATSEDCQTWSRHGKIDNGLEQQPRLDGVCLAPVGPDVDPWFEEAQLLGVCMFTEPLGPDSPGGIHAIRSLDGSSFTVRLPGILPGKGDRLYLCYDEVCGEYWLITRPYYGIIPGFKPVSGVEVVKHRMARMWKSRDMVTWEDRGIILRPDQYDPPDVQIYGMQPFRYGQGFLAMVEIYHQAIERLDTQLAWSADGVRWQRVGRREPVLPLGGEGAWDSHWVVPTLNPPIPYGDRLLIPYIGASTKHASGERHKRGIGLATIRKDGWVSLEAGRTEGVLVTKKLPLTKPMKLELNVNCYSGYVTADVIAAEPESYFEPIPGYEADASRIEDTDSTCHHVRWNGRETVTPIDCGACFLRLRLKQGSLFSYRWTQAD